MHQSCGTLELNRRFSDSPVNPPQLQDDKNSPHQFTSSTSSNEEDVARNSSELSKTPEMKNVKPDCFDKESLLSKSESEPSLEADSLQDQNSNKNSTDTDSEIISLSISMDEMSDSEKKHEQLHIEFENFTTSASELGKQQHF